MKVRVYLQRPEYGHIDFDDVESTKEAEERFKEGDYDADDVEFDTWLDDEWSLDDYTPKVILEE